MPDRPRVAAVTAAAMLMLCPGGAASVASAAGVTVPRFVEETAASGVEHVYDGEFEYFVGGGVAAFDCDQDGFPELYLAGGSRPAGLYHNDSLVGGMLAFSQLSDPATDLAEVTGAYPLDVDGDDQVDLALLRLGEDVLLRGLGGCQFERANEAWSFDGGEDWTTAFSAKWETDAAFPTLAFGNYVDRDGTDTSSTSMCSDNVLVRPDPTASGYGAATALTPGWCSLSMLFSDWDRSGRRDLRISNDRHYAPDGEEQLWRIADGAAPSAYSRDDGWEQLQIWGMGIASHDLTGDGLPEVYLTSMGDNKLQTLTDGSTQPTYEDIALELGVTAHRPHTGGDALPSTAWHAEFQDVNNDSFVDLFIAKGNVEAMTEFAQKDPSNLLLGKPDGTFVERAKAAGILGYARGRGAAVVDLNLDGMLDLVEVNRREPAELWRNVGAGKAARPAQIGSWLGIRLAQPGSNRDAVGSWVEVSIGDRTLRREVTIGGGHAGGQLGWLHFGLGDADVATVRVQWPGGEWSEPMDAGANGFVSIERGVAEPVPWLPPDAER